MDEAGARDLLGQLADTEPPPARVDLGAAIAAGRRGRRWRRVRVGGSVLAAAGAVAALAALLVVPPTRQALVSTPGQVAVLTPRPAVVPTPRLGHQPAGDPATPARFDALVPYASFGWLPPGFHTGADGGTMSASTPVGLRLVAVSGGALIELAVNPAGTCHLEGQTLACSAYNTTSPVQSRAPDVHGHRAYWLKGAQLAWEYAPGAWSVLSWPGANAPWPPAGRQRTAVLRVAAGVRYGQATPIRFPYRFSGLPAGWRVSEVDYTVLAGQPVVQTLNLDDYPGDTGNFVRADVDEVWIYATQAAHSDRSCPGGTGQHVTVHGTAAILVGSAGAGQEQELCIPDWRGLQVQVILSPRQTAPAPDPTGAHGVLAYARLLYPLGPDPAHWTASLLR